MAESGVDASELGDVEAACKQLLALLGSGGFRARVERRIVSNQAAGLLGRAHELRVAGVAIWRGQWVAEGRVARWEGQWLVDPKRLIR